MGIMAFFGKLFGGKESGTYGQTENLGKGNGNGDSQLLCAECRRMFIFESGEQKFYKMRGLTPPKRCPSCRMKRKRHHRR